MRTLGPIVASCALYVLRPWGTSAATEAPRAAPQARPPQPARPNFTDVAPSHGLNAVLHAGGPNKEHILESVGTGAAFVDYDRDGRLDIFLVNAWLLEEEPSGVARKDGNILFCNTGQGKFEDVTDRAGLRDRSWGCGVCAADYNNDGWVDLYVTNFGPNRLYRNRGDGTFEEVGEKAGVADSGWSTGSAFFDADGDGDLDLYVANYIDCTFDEVLAARRTILWREKVKVLAGPFGMRGGKDSFYRNNGNGTFTDATIDAGMEDVAESYGLGVLASDLDEDGDIDIYVANDSNPNSLYRNEGNGTFTEIGSWSGAGLSGEGVAQAGMGVDAGDFDGDGRQDIFVTNFVQDTATLYRNEGSLLFVDISGPLRLKAATYDVLKWGCAFFDYDHDADLDIVIANGHIYPQVDDVPELKETYRQKMMLLRNDSGRLNDVSPDAGSGFASPISARGLATGDYDDDGDLDLLVTAMDAPPLLLRNDTEASGHWLKLRVLNRHGSPAINARVSVTAGKATQTRELRSGSSYASQNALELHFGLGKSPRAEKVEVRWPGGATRTLENVDADHTLTIPYPEPAAANGE